MLNTENERPGADEPRFCACCGIAFKVSASRIKNGGGRFCGRECRRAYTAIERAKRIADEAKVCASCGVAKPMSAYHIHKRTGLPSDSRCKPCAVKKRAERKKAQFPEGKPQAQVERERAYTRAYEERNKERRKAMNHQNYLKNKEKVLARGLAWIRAHPEANAARMARRRAKASAADSHTAEDIKALLKVQRGLCAVCKCDLKGGYQVDHIIPLARGGGNDKKNIQLLCKPCNCSKNAKHPVDFMQEKGFLL